MQMSFSKWVSLVVSLKLSHDFPELPYVFRSSAFGFYMSVCSHSHLVLHLHLIGVCNVNTRSWIWRLIEHLLVEAGVIYGLTSCIMDNPFYV